MKKYKIKNIRIRPLHPSIQVIGAVLLFSLAVFFSQGEEMTSWEESLFLAVYGWPDIFLPFFFIITQAGSIHMLGVLLLFFLIKRKHRMALRLLLTATLAYQLSGFAKDIWGRVRPNELLLEVINRDYIVRGPGFPSGHVALAVAMALTLGHYLPKKYHWVVWVWIIGVGISRVYLGIHAPLDIVGGFAIGWLSYSLFRHVRLLHVRYGDKKTIKTQKKSTKKKRPAKKLNRK